MSGGGQGGSGQGSGGQGGALGSVGGHAGQGGVTGGAQGGRSGQGGGSGQGGALVIGPTPSFTDNFEADGVDMRWLAPQSNDTPACGTWTRVADPANANNHVYQQSSTACTSTSTPSWAAAGSTSWTDLRLKVRVMFGASSSSSTRITVAVRYQDPKNMDFIEFTNNGGLKIRYRNSSTTSDIMTLPSAMRMPLTTGQWTTLTLAITGTTLSAYIGDGPTGTPAVTGTASGPAAGGVAIGVADGTASFDDVLVTPP